MPASNGDTARLVIYTDGGARGNPGPAGFGYVICNADGETIEGRGEFVGKTTNNVAEYKGMIAAAKRIVELGAAAAEFRVDSELLERQVRGTYRVKAPHLKPLFAELMAALGQIPEWRIRHVRREHNARADELANRAMDVRGVVT